MVGSGTMQQGTRRLEEWEKELVREIVKKRNLGTETKLAIYEVADKNKKPRSYVSQLWRRFEEALQRHRERELLKDNPRCPHCELPLVGETVTVYDQNAEKYRKHELCLKTEIQCG